MTGMGWDVLSVTGIECPILSNFNIVRIHKLSFKRILFNFILIWRGKKLPDEERTAAISKRETHQSVREPRVLTIDSPKPR